MASANQFVCFALYGTNHVATREGFLSGVGFCGNGTQSRANRFGDANEEGLIFWGFMRPRRLHG
jgi:hypothetical protein